MEGLGLVVEEEEDQVRYSYEKRSTTYFDPEICYPHVYSVPNFMEPTYQ